MYNRKRYILYGSIILAVIVVACITIAFLSYHRDITNLTAENNQLKEEINTYESEMVPVYYLLESVKAGAPIESYDVDIVNVPIQAVPENAITDSAELEGMLYKIDLEANTYLTTAVIQTDILTDDMRELDIIFAEVPIGLKEGDYIDVNIGFPLGQPFIAMSHKKVVAINNNVLKLVISQNDFYTYESMKKDVATYSSTRIFGAKYVESGIQQPAITYYPVNLEVLKTRLLDPNIDTSDYSMTLTLREQLETQLNTSDKVDINQTVTSSLENLTEQFQDARNTYNQLQEQKENSAE